LQPEFPCPKCGTQIPVGQQFCSFCGERFEYRCGHCGAIVPTLSGFCTNCGEKLFQQTQPPQPSDEKARNIHQEIAKAEPKKATHQHIGRSGLYLIFLAVILCLGAISYVILTGAQGKPSNWLGGGFTFYGKPPPTAPPSTELQQKPKPVPDLSSYTAEQVIKVAKNFSPLCRVPIKRVG